MVDVIREHIEIVEGAGGPKARIAGHRIRIQDIARMHEKLGMSPDEIVEELPTITLADVHAALAYSWDHRDEIEAAIRDEHAYAEEMRRAQGDDGACRVRVHRLRALPAP
ncbi:MAG: hypothetical protein QOF73_2808 [Thermomicrobiales bacterium]|nr:hypothetical protein [Thermomicrobiales bacterium]